MGWSKAVGLVVAAAVVVTGCSSSAGEGSDGPPPGPTSTIVLSTSSTTTSTTTTTSPTTTAPAATSTTVDAAALYAEIDAEIQRACTVAVETGQLPVPEFHTNWDAISTPEKLAAAVQSCVATRRAPPG